LQQAPTSHTTRLLVQNLHTGDTAILDFKTPRCQSTIRHWLPTSIRDSCFYSIRGTFLSFPGSNALLLFGSCHSKTHHSSACHTNHPGSTLFETRRLDLLKDIKALHDEILDAIAELQELQQELLSPLHYSCPYPPMSVLPSFWQQLSLIVTILQFQHICQTTPISIQPPPEPPPGVICPTKHKMTIDSLPAIPSLHHFSFLSFGFSYVVFQMIQN
jgi:hypothetical protein